MKFIKSVGKKPEKKAQKATDAGARARRKLQQKDHEKVNFLPMDEAKVDQGRSDYGKASIRNYRRKGPGHGATNSWSKLNWGTKKNMTKIIGLTGGIASGKTTVSKFLKKNKYAVHEWETKRIDSNYSYK